MDLEQLTTPAWPGWLQPLLGLGAAGDVEAATVAGFPVTSARHGDVGFVSLRIPDARSLLGDAFSHRVAEAYAVLPHLVEQRLALRPVRFWNFVPGMRENTGQGQDGYMRFNTGRRDGLARFRDTNGFQQWLPTASAIDPHTADLVIHVLAAATPPRPLENPRQVPAYRYSRRFGPTPPSFARATAVAAAQPAALDGAILVGGTASIVGETSRHPGDCAAQLEETLTNIAHLLARTGETLAPTEQAAWLAKMRQLRVYVVKPGDRQHVIDRLQQACPNLDRLEVLIADLCRPELLVEVEGLTYPGVFHDRPTEKPAVEASALAGPTTGGTP